MKLEEIKQLARIEYIDKTTKPGGHDRTGTYILLDNILVKNPTTKEWFDGILYVDTVYGKRYVKHIDSILKEFKLCKE